MPHLRQLLMCSEWPPSTLAGCLRCSLGGSCRLLLSHCGREAGIVLRLQVFQAVLPVHTGSVLGAGGNQMNGQRQVLR